ncbi:MAG: PKD domain-containing protein [Acidobacteria bacterium]|nr:PKD domain-containing protein [Acidobacteriota bacterium]
MKNFFHGLLLLFFVCAIPLSAQEIRSGNLDNQSTTFNRPGHIIYSINCDATWSSQYNNVRYMVFTIYTTEEEPLQAFLACAEGDDSYLLLYCDGFDPANPTQNLIAGDDDDGEDVGGSEYSSAFTASDEYVIHPYTLYKLVVTEYDSYDDRLSLFALTLYGNAHFLVGPDQMTITATADSGGTIDPAGEIEVPVFGSQRFTIHPDTGYHIGDVIVDGTGIGPQETYTFDRVTENHTIQAEFIKNQPPVITSFTADKMSGLAPLTVHFNVSAHDPDGGNIVRYNWDFNGDGVTDQISTSGSADHRFVVPGNFAVTVTAVDDEGETVSSELSVAVAKSESINLPMLTDSALKKGAADPDLHSDTWVVNTFDENATVVLTALNSNNEPVAQTTEIIPGHGKTKLSLSAFDGLDYTTVKAHPDRYLIYFSDITGNNARMASYIRTPLKAVLIAPHVAEEMAYWDTYAFISDEKPAKLNLKMGTKTLALTPEFTNMFNLGTLADSMGENSESAMWDKFISYTDNPFSDTSLMTGFEMFIKHGGDGAATELEGTGSTKLYIPHIPSETDIFWTGFAFVNSGEEDVTATATFYSDSGEVTGTSQITVPAHSKVKGLMSDLFPDAGSGAAWGIVTAAKKLVGLELYGTASGICGFSLKGESATDGIFPLMVTGENNWTGIALANPNGQEAEVTIDLVQADGTLVATKTASIPANGRFSFVAADYFSRYNLRETDYLRFHSQYGLIGVEAGGDTGRTFMVALDSEN